MIGMSFIELLGISVVVALVLHYLLKYRTVEGFEGFLGKVIVLPSMGMPVRGKAGTAETSGEQRKVVA